MPRTVTAAASAGPAVLRAKKSSRRPCLPKAGLETETGLPYAVLELLAEGLVLVDESGRVSEWNRSMEEITGVPRSQVLGRAVWDVYRENVVPDRPEAPDIKALVKALIRQALADPASPRLRARTEFTWQRRGASAASSAPTLLPSAGRTDAPSDTWPRT